MSGLFLFAIFHIMLLNHSSNSLAYLCFIIPLLFVYLSAGACGKFPVYLFLINILQ